MGQEFKVLILFTFLTTVGASTLLRANVEEQFTGKRNGSGCLTLLEKSPELFAPCKKKTCFLFLNEEPYIILDNSMAKEEHQKPFPCKAPHSAFSNLRGVAFEVHKLSKGEDSLCAWGGLSCSFNNLVDFVILQGKKNSPYKFGITGFMIQMPKRISGQILASAPVYDGKLAIVGLAETAQGTSLGLFEILGKTFTTGGHGLWLMAFAFLVLAWAYFLCITAHRDWNRFQLFSHVMGTLAEDYYRRESEELETSDDSQTHFSVYMGLRTWLRRATAVFVLVFVLFVELAIVNFLFLVPNGRIEKSISNLSDKELSRFCVFKDAATEDAFRYAVDKQGRYNSPARYPWHRSATVDECYQKVLNESDPVQFVLTFESLAWYYLRKKKIENIMTLYDTRDSLYPFSAGFFYGKSVSPIVREQMDKEILILRMNDKINAIMKEQGGAPIVVTRKTIGTRIVGETVAIYLVFFVLSFLVLILLYQRYMAKPLLPIARTVQVPSRNCIVYLAQSR